MEIELGRRGHRIRTVETQGAANIKLSRNRMMSSEGNGIDHFTILNDLDALVYVADIETHQVIFMNKYGRDRWGDPRGKSCWEALPALHSQICKACKETRRGAGTGKLIRAVAWEFQNTIDGRWYQCRDQSMHWIDGRYVKLGIASDITERKRADELVERETRTTRAVEDIGLVAREGSESARQIATAESLSIRSPHRSSKTSTTSRCNRFSVTPRRNERRGKGGGQPLGSDLSAMPEPARNGYVTNPEDL